MLFLEVTASTWLVTGLGFGIVLLLLCLFVFVMTGLGALMQWIEKQMVGGSQPKQAAPEVKNAAAEPAQAQADDLVAVAYEWNKNYCDREPFGWDMHWLPLFEKNGLVELKHVEVTKVVPLAH